MSIYTGYVYIWYDTRAKLFYVGGHKGKVEDSYICSSVMMLRAYKKRPNTFRFRVLQYVYGNTQNLREAEQYWLNKIKDQELYWTPNIKNGSVRYYNQKKTSAGGNGTVNKGKKRPNGAPNKGKPMSEEQKLKISKTWKIKKISKTLEVKQFQSHNTLQRTCLHCNGIWLESKMSKKIFCSRKCAASKNGGWNKGLNKSIDSRLSGGRKRRVSVAEYPTNSVGLCSQP